QELVHPGLVRLRSCGAVAGQPRSYFTSMELCEGGPLADFLARGAQVPSAAWLPLFRPILDTPAYPPNPEGCSVQIDPRSLFWAPEPGRAAWMLKLGLVSPVPPEADGEQARRDVTAAIRACLPLLDSEPWPVDQVASRLESSGLSPAVAATIGRGLHPVD